MSAPDSCPHRENDCRACFCCTYSEITEVVTKTAADEIDLLITGFILYKYNTVFFGDFGLIRVIKVLKK